MIVEELGKQITEVFVKFDNSVIQIVWQKVKYLFVVALVINNTLKCWFFIIQFVLIFQMVCVYEQYV
jgi:hypothetical protein